MHHNDDGPVPTETFWKDEYQGDTYDFTSQRLFCDPMDKIQRTILVLKPVFLELFVEPQMVRTSSQQKLPC